MKYIDADKLRSVLQNTINSMKEKDAKGERYDAFLNGKLSICEELLGCIASLQQEQPEVDLKEEITSFFSKNPIPYEHITDWPLLKNTALHFYELGLNARKEE